MKRLKYADFKEQIKDDKGRILPFINWLDQYNTFSFPKKVNWKETQDEDERKLCLNKAKEKRQRRIERNLRINA